MKDINLGQFLNRFINNDAGRKPQIQQQAQVENASFKAAAQNLNRPAANPLPNFDAAMQRQIAMNTAQLNQLNSMDMSQLLKDLLNLPANMKDFLLMMTNTLQNAQMTNQQLAALLLGSNLDMSKLILFMQNNGKEALAKLFQMIAGYNQMGTAVKSGQLNDLSAIINACIPGASASEAQVLKNVLLLYLPWLPLGESNAFNLDIASKSGEEGGETDDSITILIATVNFGNVQVTLFKTDKSSIDMHIVCSNEFPQEEVKAAIRDESESYNVQTGILFEEKTNFGSEKVENVKTEVSMNTSPGVNPFLILMAQSVIKVIISIDKNYSLKETRKKYLD